MNLAQALPSHLGQPGPGVAHKAGELHPRCERVLYLLPQKLQTPQSIVSCLKDKLFPLSLLLRVSAYYCEL